MSIVSENFTFKFKSQLTIYQTQVRCHVNENEFNMTLNPTTLQPYSSSLRDEVTGSYFNPYVTTVGLYNDQNELLAVSKISQPFQMPSNTDVTFIIRYDT